MKLISISKAAAICLTMCSMISSMNVTASASDIKYEYGVFLGAHKGSDIQYMEPYKTIVLDAQSFTKEEILSLKNSGHTVYSYIDLGSYEDDRDVTGVLKDYNYKEFKNLTFYDYDNWESERWVDVSRTEWQTYQSALAADLMNKGIDGFFVDNTDVYYIAKEDKKAAKEYKATFGSTLNSKKIFDGVTAILKSYKKLNAEVIINGGDTYVMDYFESTGYDPDLIDAINQETVLSEIIWGDPVTYTRKSEGEDKDYFIHYIETAKNKGKDIYMLEYTPDRSLISDIAQYARDNGYVYYACKNIDLKAPGSEAGSMPVISDVICENDNDDIDISEEISENYISAELLTDGNIGLEFYIEPEADLVSKGGYVSVKGADGNKSKISFDKMIKTDSGYIFNVYTAPKKMDKNIIVELCDKNGISQVLFSGEDGNIKNTDGFSVSVKDVLDNAKKNASGYDEAYVDLASAISNYGALTQIYNKSAQTIVPDVNAFAIDDIKASDLLSYKASTSGNVPSGFTFSGASLSFKDKTTLRIYFKVASGKSVPAVKYGSKKLTPVKSGNSYYVEVANIDDTNYTDSFSVKFGSKYTVKVSAMSYIYSVLKNYDGKKNPELCQMIKAYYSFISKASEI